MINNLKEKLKVYKNKINTLNTIEELENIYGQIFGSNGIFKEKMKELKETKDIEMKRQLGPFLNNEKKEIIFLINNKKSLIQNEQENIELKKRWMPLLLKKSHEMGFEHPIEMLKMKLENFLLQEGFENTIDSPVETMSFNFSKLNISHDHPAFNEKDTFFIDEKSNQLLLRSHCTSTTARQLERNSNKEFSSFTIGEVFRRDTDDATHSHQFIHLDAISIKENISIEDLRNLLTRLIHYIFEDNVEFRFRPSYFPFTTPSFEVDIKCLVQGDHGDSCICKGTKWIEILGGGMIHKNVLKQANYKNNKLTGVAFGMGVDRLACLLFDIPDIRMLYENKLDFLSQLKRKNK